MSLCIEVGSGSTFFISVIREGRAYETKVELGAMTHHFVQVVKGLSENDTVATSGGYELPEGCPVKIVADTDSAGEKTH